MSTPSDSQQVFKHLLGQIKVTLQGKIKDDKYKEMINAEIFLSFIDDFINDSNIKLLFLSINNDEIHCEHTIPKSIKKKALYFVKTDLINDEITMNDINHNILCGELNEHSLDSLHLITQEVYFPLLNNANNC